MSNNVVYLSGPISGRPEGNRPAFDRAAENLRAAGYQVVNPHEVFTEEPPADHADLAEYWVRAMRADLVAMMRCTHICRLPEWEHSRGATIESRLAADLRFGVVRLDGNLEPVR
ncbi:hypothetical protein GCM10028796_17260 [Ramlibacter monticola]|uniref:DUF4406 domain-containing protein n=1 Tax=Ramlibacter monticola TaxID=1926872 RepID=A0A936YXQ4_9BURK|nr:DUF4406 domain-containing protein [Ramlibacter monticola]MBL0390552.1 DUF4406 domain-containing protein [Ramlibacter monticola]